MARALRSSVAEPPLSAPAVPALRIPAGHAWAIWAIGAFAYSMAVFHRSALGVAGLAAQDRFAAGAALLSTFTVLQLGVYAAMQIPVGGLVDRIGPRRMIAIGAVVMAAGQFLLATAHDVPLAVAARVLVGAGDAMTFVSVLRLVTSWFPPSRVPIVTQLTGIIGQVGQIAAAYPLLALLHTAGWTATFAGAGALGLVTAAVVRAAVRDTPPGAEPPEQVDNLRTHLRLSWLERGTRLGLWTHFVSQFSGMVFVLVWGYPFLVKGEGLSPAIAGALLTLMVPLGIAAGIGFGHLVSRWPLRRSTTIIGVVATTATTWTVVLAWPGRAPLALLIVLVAVLATNGPAAAVGFDFARTFNPKLRVGSATGIVNVGGFVASLATIFSIGLILDALTPAGSTGYSLDSFRAAFSVQYLVWAAGLYAVLRHRRYLRRRHVEETGVPIDPLHRAALRRLRAGRLDRRPATGGPARRRTADTAPSARLGGTVSRLRRPRSRC